MSVEEAWRLLADTNHLNRTVGLPAVSFSPLDSARGEFTRGAETKAFGFLPLSWKEYPFDWVRNRGYKVRREFDRGPRRGDSAAAGLSRTNRIRRGAWHRHWP